MILPDGLAIYLCNSSVDMRKAINGLSILVSEHLERNPSDGSLYVFINRQRNKIKCLYFDKNGFALWYKRLERGRFKVPRPDDQVYELESRQLRWLLDGLDYRELTGYETLSFQHFS